MAIHVALNHVTHYRYDRLVRRAPASNAPHCRSRCCPIARRSRTCRAFHQLAAGSVRQLAGCGWCSPRPDRVQGLGRPGGRDGGAQPLRLLPRAPAAENFPFRLLAGTRGRAAPTASPGARRHARFLPGTVDRKQRTIDFLVGINQKLQQDIRTRSAWSPACRRPSRPGEAQRLLPRHRLAAGAAAAPSGLAARFVSGYLDPAAPDVKAIDGPSGTEVDFTDLHAWCEVFLPGAGWIGLDPTSGLLAGEATSRWPARPSRPARRRSTARSTNARSRSSTTWR